MNNKVLLTTISTIILLSLIPYSFADDTACLEDERWNTTTKSCDNLTNFYVQVSTNSPIVGESTSVACDLFYSSYSNTMLLEIADGDHVIVSKEIYSEGTMYTPLTTSPLEITCYYSHPDGGFERSITVTPISSTTPPIEPECSTSGFYYFIDKVTLVNEIDDESVYITTSINMPCDTVSFESFSISTVDGKFVEVNPADDPTTNPFYDEPNGLTWVALHADKLEINTSDERGFSFTLMNTSFGLEPCTDYYIKVSLVFTDPEIDSIDLFTIVSAECLPECVEGEVLNENNICEVPDPVQCSDDKRWNTTTKSCDNLTNFYVQVSTNSPIVGESTSVACDLFYSSYSNTMLLEIADGDHVIVSKEIYSEGTMYTPLTTSPLEITCLYTHPDGDFERSITVTPIIGSTTPPTIEPVEDDDLPKKSGGSSNEWKTKPTFGLSHQTFLPLVDGGFTFNGMTHDITDNWHTDFPIQNVTLGEQNTFEARVYAEKNLMVQEFLFGIPEAGASHEAELGVEIWYDYDGNIEDIVIVQETEVVDVSSVNVTHSMVKCQSSDNDENCHSTILSMTFLEPLEDDVMAIKAIDFKHRDHITYLNEGFDISGISLNPMISLFISGTEKHEGLIEITQTAKYSDLWIAEDGREFNANEAGSFKWINHVFERFVDSGEPRTRSHSAFTDLIVSQQNIAQQTINEKYGSIESVSRDDMISQSKLIISNIEELQNLDELSTTCTALHIDYDARILLQAEYPYLAKDNKNSMFTESLLDGFPLIELSELINTCDIKLQTLTN